MNKHAIKGWLRRIYSGCIAHTGLWRLVSRLSGRRLVILAGHCVGDAPGLPADMTLSEQRVQAITRALSKGFSWRTIGAGYDELLAGQRGPSMVAWSLDDGYRDNHDVFLPLLEASGARATLFLEGRPLLERRISWSHMLFWLVHQAGQSPAAIALALAERQEEGLPGQALRQAAEAGERVEYRVKRVLKYDCDATVRDHALQELFLAAGGDEAAWCERLYMSPAMAQRLDAAGVELGGHTYSHEVLATLTEARASEEIETGRDALQQVLPGPRSTSFAYPYGRRWDFRESEVQALRSAGYRLAVTTHSGVVKRDSDPYRLPRIMVDESTPIAHILCEASGAYAWLRRFGIDLAE